MPSQHNYIECCRKLAVLGGTFDPIHNGHIAAALAVHRELKPQRVLFIPAGEPPHKGGRTISPGDERYQMVLRSVAQVPFFDASRMEIRKNGPSYTIDTARALKSILPAGGELLFIVGADMIVELTTWRDYTELLSIAAFAVVPRQGFDGVLENSVDALQREYGARIHVLKSPLVNISSSDIRTRLESGLPVCDLMPREALDYISAEGMYGMPEILSHERFEQVKSAVKEMISERRFLHTLGTIEAAEQLASHYGADVRSARWAALLHDIAKEFSSDKKHALCELWNIPLDEVLLESIDITHSLLGAELASREFHIKDEGILNAIRYHTTGHKGMSLLDKVIMLADYIDPNRDDYEPLGEIRRLAFTDIDKALAVGIKSTNKDLKETGKSVHRWSKDALKELRG